jgi:hypothetical protein
MSNASCPSYFYPVSYPKIDKRSVDVILKQLRQYAQFYTQEWDATNELDAGVGLSKIFCDLLFLVIERLNRVPQRNYIEFLNMLGLKLTPAQPARAFVTFTLSEGLKQDVLVPSGTKLAAAANDKHGELTFETQDNLIASRAKLQEVYSVVNNIDAIYRHTPHITTGKNDTDGKASSTSFSFFSGSDNGKQNGSGLNTGGNIQKHILYIAHSDLFNIKKNFRIILHIRSPSAEESRKLKKLLEEATWEYNWKIDPKTGEEIAEQMYVVKRTGTSVGGRVAQTNMKLKLSNDFEIELSFSNYGHLKFDKNSYDIQYDKTISLTLDLAESAAITSPTKSANISNGVNIQTVLLKSTTDPYGIYLDLSETATNSGIYKADIELTSTDSSSFDRQLKSFVIRAKQGDTLTAVYLDPAFASTASIVNARDSPEIEKFKFNGVESRWIRCSILPFEKSKYVEEEYFELLNGSHIDSLQLEVRTEEGVDYPDLLFYNDVPINFRINRNTSDFEQTVHPFGQKPRTLDSFYISSPDIFSKKGAKILLTLKGKHLKLVGTNPVLSWQYWNGMSWTSLNVDVRATTSPDTFHVEFMCPLDMDKVNVNGTESYWIKIRIALGNYIRNRYPKLNKLEIQFNVPPQYPEHAQTYNNLEYQTELMKLDGTIKPFRSFVPVPDTHPTIYFGFNEPLEQGPISLYFSIDELEFQENTLPCIEYYYYPSSSLSSSSASSSPSLTREWKKVESVVDETRNFTWRGLVKFLFPPRDFEAKSIFGKNLYWLKAVDVKDKFAPSPESFELKELFGGYTDLDYPWDVLKKNFNISLKLGDLKRILRNIDMPSPYNISAKEKRVLPRLATINERKPVLCVGNSIREIFTIKSKLKLLTGGIKSELATLYLEPVPALPKVRGVFLNAASALNVVSTDDEIIGTSNGKPSQTFGFANLPLAPRDQFSTQIWINEGKILSPQEKKEDLLDENETESVKDQTGNVIQTWVQWHEVDDIYTSNPKGRHYELDRALGKILLGDGSFGMIPPTLRENIRADYAAGGGSEGNVESNEINALKNTLPFVETVDNPEPAEGGLDVETVQAALSRGPQRIRNRGQAVSPDDFQWIVRENFPSIAKVKCLPNTSVSGKFAPGKITIVIVPSSSEEKPIASLELLSKVQHYLEKHSSNVVVKSDNLVVMRPIYVKISVSVDVYPISIDLAHLAEQRVISSLKMFLNPLSGGPEHSGWDFGRMICESDIFSLLENIHEVHHVDSLSVIAEIEDSFLRDRQVIVIKMPSSLYSSPIISALASTTPTESSAFSHSDGATTTATADSVDVPLTRMLPHYLIYGGTHTVTLKLEKKFSDMCEEK